MNKRTTIEKKAETLLKNCKITEMPVPLKTIADKLEINIQYEKFEDELSGFLFRGEDNTIIGVNAVHLEKRQRFTIAHELGHYILHEGHTAHVDKGFRVNFRNGRSSQAVDLEEIEANAFAAALLMPEKEVKRIIKKKLSDGIDLENSDELKKIADHFQVSQQAMLIRLIRLGIINEMELS